jgi:membrane protease YdiL (CAAX protease family)
LIALLPVFSFTIAGLENSSGINIHYYAFIYASFNVMYAFLEEFGWRRYLQNALEGVNKNWKYILIGIIWWIWHLRLETQFDLFIFPIICIGGGYLLGKLTDDTKSILPVVSLHTLIILLTNSGAITMNKIIGISLTIIGWLIIEQIWKRKKGYKKG